MKDKDLIIIMDYERKNATEIQRILGNNYDYIIVENEEAIVNELRYNKNVSVVLLHLTSENMSGGLAIKQWDQFADINRIPIVVYSASNEDAIEEIALIMGADDYLEMPFREVVVRQRIVNCIQRYHLQKKMNTRNENIYNNLPGAVAVFGVVNNLLHMMYVSNGGSVITGYSTTEMKKRFNEDPTKHIYPEDRKKVKKIFTEGIERKESISFTYRMICKRGVKWISLSISPVIEKDKLTYYGVFADVDEQHKKEEEYYKQLGILSNNNEKNLIAKAQYNLTQKKLLFYEGLYEDAIKINSKMSFQEIKETFLKVVDEKEKKEVIQELFDEKKMLSDISEGKKEGEIEYKRKEKNNSVVYSLTKYLIFAEPNTKDVILFIYGFDNTEKKLEQKIIEQIGSDEYDVIGILDINTESYFMKSMQENIKLRVTEKGENYFEKCVALVKKMIAKEEQDKIIQNITMDNLKKQLENKRVFSFNYTAVIDSQRKIRKSLQFKYMDESRTSILFTDRDITLLYQQEQIQLRKTEKALAEAKRANAAKTDFLSRMSHDIRTPMNAIIGMTKLALEEGCSDKIRNYLEGIDASSSFLLGLINDILDLSKIESGQFNMNPEPYQMGDFVMSIDSIIRPLMEKKHITFEYDFETKDICFITDKLRFDQIFFNLLSNAAKFTQDGGKVIFSCRNLPDANGRTGLEFKVSDNGIGMTEKFQKHLFEPFSQERQKMTRGDIGTGLGLPIVKRIVDAMGGKLTVNSKQGEGTEFILNLYMEFAKKRESEKKKKLDDIKIQKAKILLVEDNEINITVASHLLEKKECNVTVAQNGAEAVEIFQKSEVGFFDAILMDVRMPVLDGINATKKIRRLKREDGKIVPIIAMTADAFTEEQKQTLEAGMNYHLSKPINPQEMFQVLEKYINNYRERMFNPI